MKRVGLLLLFVIIGSGMAGSASAHPSSETGWGNAFADRMAHGDSHLILLEYARALESYEQAARMTPHAAAAQIKIALTLYKWGNAVPARRNDLWPAAIKAADRARFLDPTNADAGFISAVVRYRMGDHGGAVTVYKMLERVRQGDPDLYLDLAVVAIRAGDSNLATAALTRARAVDPTNKRLYLVAKEIFIAR